MATHLRVVPDVALGGLELRHDRPRAELAARLERGDLRLGSRELLGRVVEDGAAVLRAAVVALPVERRRVVQREEDVEQPLEGHRGRLERDAHGLGVARRALAHLAVLRVLRAAANVARHGGGDAADVREG